ncbi:hypothetical protein MVEN_00600600 [Mycena venus]|uniref:BTB domain-containing protein n=1 Tax=Mycena venus TaxID=2733690 RepID=A0A8H6YPM3_9AGAR|nr:hypothetical protein MVEN_00600600 [Mycena venus]
METPTEPQTSERFCSPDADITIASADVVLFMVHREKLEEHSVIFADAGNATGPGNRDEIVHLTETSDVLDLLFQCMYELQPNLQLVDFPVFAELAEAAEKYMMHSAIPAVLDRMYKCISEHPLQVLEYASKHDHKDLGNEAARACISEHPLHVLDFAAKYDLKALANEAARLSIGLPISAAASSLAPVTFTKWMIFYDKWHADAQATLIELGKLRMNLPVSADTVFKVAGFFATAVPLLGSVFILDDSLHGGRPFERKFMSTLLECAHDPLTWYKVRQRLENEFVFSGGSLEMVAGLLKFLDNEFLSES